MRILLAPNAFKGSLSATSAIGVMRDAIGQVDAEIEVIACPIADGGDGFAEVMQAALAAEWVTERVSGPTGSPVDAGYLYSEAERIAVIESAQACGLALLEPTQRDPLTTTSRGVGELMQLALARGARHLIVGIGGTASNDAGIGLATALGLRFLDEADRPIATPDGAALERIRRIDTSRRLPALDDARIDVVCDVDNPLLGPQGATAVYAPQKGADTAAVTRLENGMVQFNRQLKAHFGLDLAALPGAGAGGGLAGGLAAMFRAGLRPGIEVVFEATGLNRQLPTVDLVITTEGRLDRQTLEHGKAPVGVARLAARHRVPCVVIAGEVTGDTALMQANGISAAFSLCPGPVTLEQAMREAPAYLQQSTSQVLRLFLAGRAGHNQ